MRVLLFIEPHPVRDTKTHFQDIARRFLPLLSSPTGYDVRLFANAATVAQIGPQALPGYAGRLIKTTPEEEDALDVYQKLSWEDAGLSLWLDLMAGRGDVSDHYVHMLRRIWRIFPFEIIVHWGENGAITRFVNERPVTRVAMELGCTRPPFLDSITMDPFGTNGSAVLPKLDIEDLRRIVDDRPMSRHEALFGFSKDITAQAYAQQFKTAPQEPDLRSRAQKIAFLPLQLYDDANLLRFSPYRNLSEVVLDIVPRLSDAGYFTVIKPHPASRFRSGAALSNCFAKSMLYPWADRISWCDDPAKLDNARLFSMADLVVTVNSSVGFEALYFDKTAVVLGDAVYKPKSMFPGLDDVLSDNFDRAAYLDKAGILRRFMLGGYLQPETLREDASSFLGRLGLIHHLAQHGQTDPRRFATDYWRATAPAQTALAASSRFWGLSVPGKQDFGRPPQPPALASSGSGMEAKLEALIFRPFLRQMKRHWTAHNTRLWLEVAWTTQEGREEAILRSQIVDPDHYLALYPDVRASGTDPVAHFCRSGHAEGRSPRENISEMDEATLLAAVFTALTTEQDTHPPCPFEPGHKPLEQLPVPESSEAFLGWLKKTWSSAEGRTELVSAGALVDADHYLAKYPDVKSAGIDPARHYAQAGINESRTPRPNMPPITSDEFLARLIAAEATSANNTLPLYPFEKKAEQIRTRQLRVMRQKLGKRENRIAVVAHLYYADLVPTILDAIGMIKEPFDLIVTLPDWGTRKIIAAVKTAFPNVVFFESPNRGRDIGPFLDILPLLLDKNYDAVLKLQTKRGYFQGHKMVPAFGDIWRNESLTALLGTPDRVANILQAFRTRPWLNMVGPAPLLCDLNRYPPHDGGALAEILLGTPQSQENAFFAGTMFWVRPACLAALTRLSQVQFAPENGENDGALAHLVERLFGQVAGIASDGLATAPINPEDALVFAPAPAPQTLHDYLAERHHLAKTAAPKADEVLIW